MDAPSETSNLHHQAIDAALDSRWEDAIRINKKILNVDPKNIDALNRQAKACMELGKLNLAKKSYAEVLEIDPYNPIAQKNLKILKSFKGNKEVFVSCNQTRLSPSLFLQEPGKTKTVNLLKIAEPQKLSHTFCGMKVEMAIKNRRITIVDQNGNYLGVLPDDVSHNLLRLFKGGNKYDLFIKSVRLNSLSIIIKETFRSKRFKNQPSFLEFSAQSVSTTLFAPLEDNEEESDSLEGEQEI